MNNDFSPSPSFESSSMFQSYEKQALSRAFGPAQNKWMLAQTTFERSYDVDLYFNDSDAVHESNFLSTFGPGHQPQTMDQLMQRLNAIPATTIQKPVMEAPILYQNKQTTGQGQQMGTGASNGQTKDATSQNQSEEVQKTTEGERVAFLTGQTQSAGVQVAAGSQPPEEPAPQHNQNGTPAKEKKKYEQCRHRNVYKIIGEDFTRQVQKNAEMKRIIEDYLPSAEERQHFDEWLTSPCGLNKMSTKKILKTAWVIDEKTDYEAFKTMKRLIRALSFKYFEEGYAERHINNSRKINDQNRGMYQKYIDEYKKTLVESNRLGKRWSRKRVLGSEKTME